MGRGGVLGSLLAPADPGWASRLAARSTNFCCDGGAGRFPTMTPLTARRCWPSRALSPPSREHVLTRHSATPGPLSSCRSQRNCSSGREDDVCVTAGQTATVRWSCPSECPSRGACSPVFDPNYVFDLGGAKRARTADLLHAMNHRHGLPDDAIRCANWANTNSRQLSLTQADAR